MDLKLKAYKMLCDLEVFKINGIRADKEDFGTQEDRAPEEAEPWCCGDMQFEGFSSPTKEVLSKYKISEKEYYEIVGKLETVLSFGYCGLCS